MELCSVNSTNALGEELTPQVPLGAEFNPCICISFNKEIDIGHQMLKLPKLERPAHEMSHNRFSVEVIAAPIRIN